MKATDNQWLFSCKSFYLLYNLAYTDIHKTVVGKTNIVF